MTAGKCYYVDRADESSAEYACDVCGSSFIVDDGQPIECPQCAEIANAPELKPCPHCGGSARIGMAWEGEGIQIYAVYRVTCHTCKCQTRGCNYADDAAMAWNDRVEAGE